MKILALVLGLIFSTPAFATSDEVLVGSVTQHFMVESRAQRAFENKIGDDGKMILNPMVGYRRVLTVDDGYFSLAGFAGENSIGEGMLGLAVSTGATYGPLRFGILGGVYVQDNGKFEDRNVLSSPGIMEVDGIGLIPLIGLELSLRKHVSKDTYLTLVNVITPILSSSMLGVGFEL